VAVKLTCESVLNRSDVAGQDVLYLWKHAVSPDLSTGDRNDDSLAVRWAGAAARLRKKRPHQLRTDVWKLVKGLAHLASPPVGWPAYSDTRCSPRPSADGRLLDDRRAGQRGGQEEGGEREDEEELVSEHVEVSGSW
jgi:hypothetical protein